MNSPDTLHFRLYVAGSSPGGQRALASIAKIRQHLFDEHIQLEVVDILMEPAKAEEDHIIAVPALVRLSPAPRYKIIGDLTNAPNLRAFFGL
ncbi:MAG: circadian clock KaiB family protein [Magnetococcales bacterium]|nr:circadian clock KaiB family protein [Magnetococcales bacterium]